MIRVYQVKCASSQKSEIEAQLLKKLHIKKEDLFMWSIHRQSVDARHKKVLFSYIIDCKVKNEKRFLSLKDVKETPDETYHMPPMGFKQLLPRPIVVGFGPAGMFASVLLAQAGFCPIILERGSQVYKRKETVEHFWKTGELDDECNVQFGQGGAGAFSDGKLTTRSKDKRARKVLEELVKWGAKEEILIDSHPHIGTDAFLPIIERCQKEIERLGGTFYFDTRLDGIQVENNCVHKIVTNYGDFESDVVVLAIGHSASDTIRMLHEKGVRMENKPFAVGVRIEHKQSFINEAMLKECAHDENLIPARYQVTMTASNKKGVYSFCMCPGGYVIPSSCQANQLVINGMSYASRGGDNANSALLVQVNESDYGTCLFDGLKYQEDLEKKAYEMASDYKACVQLARDYLANTVSDHFEEVIPTYFLGTKFVDLNLLFSDRVNQALHEGLIQFEKKIPGFANTAVLSAVESRSSASVRINRDEACMTNIEGLYACGEGSGYAGGIMTSAIDGLKCAESIIGKYNNAMLQYKKEKENDK